MPACPIKGGCMAEQHTHTRTNTHTHKHTHAHTCAHTRAHTHTHMHAYAQQLSEAKEAHEASLSSLNARVEFFQYAAAEAGKEAEELRHK